MWEISKSFNFCYGHRVWTQELNKEFSLDSQCKCRHLHGHEATVDVTLRSNELDKSGMVTDFKHLNWLKQWLDDYVDHKFIMDKNDPLFTTMFKPNRDDVSLIPIDGNGYVFEMQNKIESSLAEYYEGFFIVDFPPTSENLSKWIYEFTKTKMKPLCEVSSVTWHETPKSVSVYNGESE
jgi:6-pyruvoyltetrahydropterin/6-carboxytetrahydropterin synthase